MMDSSKELIEYIEGAYKSTYYWKLLEEVIIIVL